MTLRPCGKSRGSWSESTPASPDRMRVYRFRFRAILVMFILMIGAVGGLAGQAADQSSRAVHRDAEISRIAEDARGAAGRADEVGEINRINFCRFLRTLVDNPPPDPTADQSVRWAGYRDMYGTGTAAFPGLRCTEVLPGG